MLALARTPRLDLMLDAAVPTLVLAPMDGVTDAPMRDFIGEWGVFDYAVTEFLRVSAETLPQKVFRREVPELLNGCLTQSGLPVQVQILGGDPVRMAQTALNACAAGANSIDINFGCPAPTVNRHDGGASLLKEPLRIRELVRAIRDAVPPEIPVSAKLRLGWADIDDIFENAEMAAEGGANWITIHARTREQSYRPPVYWPHIKQVREQLDIPIIANGDIWTFNDFLQCESETGCLHYMLGRSALANPGLPSKIKQHMSNASKLVTDENSTNHDWQKLFTNFIETSRKYSDHADFKILLRLKQWIKFAHMYGTFPHFHSLKQTQSLEEFMNTLRSELTIHS